MQPNKGKQVGNMKQPAAALWSSRICGAAAFVEQPHCGAAADWRHKHSEYLQAWLECACSQGHAWISIVTAFTATFFSALSIPHARAKRHSPGVVPTVLMQTSQVPKEGGIIIISSMVAINEMRTMHLFIQ
jgi:hypothetical protein